MHGPRLTPLVQSLPATVPFVGPEQQERSAGRVFRARIGANESCFGPSPRVLEAIAEAAPHAWKYGDPQVHDLRAALAQSLGVGPENVLVGEGIDGILGNLVRLTVAPGDAVVTSDGAYPTFNFHVAGHGGVLHKVPYAGDHEDPQGLIETARAVDAKLIYLANPDNPMGSWHSAETLGAMIEAVPEGCLLVLDEAYVELAPAGTAPPIDPGDPRVVRLRTFSKAHGLAGLRVGYAVGHPGLISAFDRVRNHFGMGGLVQAAALAALQDTGWLAHVQAQVIRARARLAGIAEANGLRPLPSAANFVTMDCGGDGARARAVLAGLVARGVFVRMPFVAPHDRCIRVSCAPDPVLDIFAEALPEVLGEV